MRRSIIYRNLELYRLVMNLLYKGRYRARFERVCALIRATDSTVLELCFGDVAVAEDCRRHGKRWTGLDLSDVFVAHAVGRGFDARQADILQAAAWPASDLCIMMGSLYHFKAHLPALFRRIHDTSPRFVLSEPVRNWTHANGFCRFLARALTCAGTREETFRFDEAALTQTLEELKAESGFEYRVVHVDRDMIVEVVWSS